MRLLPGRPQISADVKARPGRRCRWQRRRCCLDGQPRLFILVSPRAENRSYILSSFHLTDHPIWRYPDGKSRSVAGAQQSQPSDEPTPLSKNFREIGDSVAAAFFGNTCIAAKTVAYVVDGSIAT